ncbi:MAG: hypothetical protein IJV80_00535, partial [Clostridia bacterium]|nr:hypothetical protein [Clostridia bacterium]
EAYYSNKGQFSVSVDAIQYPTYSFTVNNDAAKGTLTPQEPFKSAYKAGTQVRFTLDVIGNNRVQDIRFNGSTLTAINGVYTVTIGETNNVLDVLYYDIEPEPTYPLTVTNDPNKGTISPTISNSSYESGTTLSFGITTTEGYSVQQVLFNGVVVSPVGGFYTVTIAPLDNVLTIIYAHEGAGVAPESPPAEPEPPTPTLYSLSVSNNEDFGSLSFENPMQNAYEEGTTISFTIEPEEGYGIYEVLFNGEELVEENGVYTFTIVSTGNLLEIDYEELEPEDDPPQSSSSTSSSTTEDGGCSSTVSGSWLCGVAFIGAAMLLKKTKRKE